MKPEWGTSISNDFSENGGSSSVGNSCGWKRFKSNLKSYKIDKMKMKNLFL